jgi:hypothetical protein
MNAAQSDVRRALSLQAMQIVHFQPVRARAELTSLAAIVIR